jgi:glycosyltransferase involved in cell wall biosynthesis
MNNHFVIVIGSRNNAQWVESNINSVLSQDYSDYEVRYFDDASEDDTKRILDKLTIQNPKFHVTHTTKRQYKTWFFSNLGNVRDSDILVFLDGDDMFYCENVLSYLNEVYNQSKCWVTYGGMLVWGGGSFISDPFPQNSEIPEEVKKNKSYRKDMWRTSHLKSMRGFLWNNFNKEDFFVDGKYMVGPDDLAIMFAMLEMAPPKKVFRVTDPLYLYNHTQENQQSRAFTDQKSIGIDYEAIIRQRTPYDTLPFVTPTLVGGLGNQMFEIAAAAALAKDNGAVMLVNYNEHNCPNQGRNVKNYLDNVFSKLVFETDLKIENMYEQEDYKVRPIPFKPNIRLAGHFQALKYFDNHKKYIQDLFGPTKAIEKELNEKFPWLFDATAIQVRRGDALEARCIGYHPVPTVEYFQEAVKAVGATKIVVFSDDMPWCKENLKFDVPCNFDACQGVDRDYLELYMMARCKNIIISASTFGWWGAYLNTRTNKQVIAPSLWFGPKLIERGFDVNDLLPPDWKRL